MNHKYINFGATCNVYSVNRNVVAKKYKLRSTFEFFNERGIMKYLRHPNIVEFYMFQVYKHVSQDITFFEKLDKDLYRSEIKREKLNNTIEQLLDGLVYIHSSGFIHRDIKSTNIMMKGDTVKYIDFGSAIYNNGDLKFINDFTTTTNRAPENLLKHENYDEKIDIWSLGIVI